MKNIAISILGLIRFRGSFYEKVAALLLIIRLSFKSAVFKRNNQKVSEHFLKYTFWGYDYPSIDFLFREVFFGNEYYFEPATKQPQIIDCGANIGMSVLYFKKMFPSAKIKAFEANPYAFKLLEENMRANNFEDVELHNIALYDKETEISFFIGDFKGSVVGSVNKGRGGNNELKVKAEKLSKYLEKMESVDLIKMDVEGAEESIILDLFDSATINKAREYIIEYHHNINDNSTLSAFLQKFELNGFRYKIKASFQNTSYFQDVLIHFYKN